MQRSLVEWPIAVCACLLCALCRLFVYTYIPYIDGLICVLCCCVLLPFLFNSRFVLPFPSIRLFARCNWIDPGLCSYNAIQMAVLFIVRAQANVGTVCAFVLEGRSQRNLLAGARLPLADTPMSVVVLTQRMIRLHSVLITQTG